LEEERDFVGAAEREKGGRRKRNELNFFGFFLCVFACVFLDDLSRPDPHVSLKEIPAAFFVIIPDLPQPV